MQANQTSVDIYKLVHFLLTDSYNQIFLTLTLVSIVPIVLSIIIMKRRVLSPTLLTEGLSVEL